MEAGMSDRMGLLKRLRLGMKLAGNLTDEERQILAKVLPGTYRSTPYRGSSGMLKAYSKSPWVRATVGKIADMVGSTKWMLFALRNTSGKFVKAPALQSGNLDVKAAALGSLDVEGELVPILDHPFLRLLNTANPMFPGNVGRSQTQVALELTGEAHWILEPQMIGERAVPERFWLIPSTWIQGMPTPDEPFWQLQTPTWYGQLPAEAIFRFVTPDPENPYGRGSGLMRAFGDEIDTDEYAAQYSKNFFLNRARPDLLITAANLSKSDTDRMEVSWLQQLQGFVNAHKPYFLGKKVDVTNLSQRFSDLGMGELRKWERDILVHGLGMPPEILGIIESSNRATIEAADYLMASYVVTPRLELQRSFLQFLLLPLYDERLILAYESPVQEDREYQLAVMKSRPEAFRISDWKRQAGIEPEEEDDVYLMPFNLEIRDELRPGASAATALPRAAEEHRHEIKDGACSCGYEVPKRIEMEVRTFPLLPGRKQIGGEDTAALALKLSPELQKEIIEAFTTLRNSLDLQALAAAIDAGNVEAALAIINQADIEAGMEGMRQLLREAVVLTGEAAAQVLGAALDVSITFTLTNPEAAAFLEGYGAEAVTAIGEETRAAIREALVNAYREGKTGAETAQEIREMIGLTEQMERQRERLIADMLAAGASEEEVAVFIDKWTAAKIRYRAQVIAENELVFAGNSGQEMLWDQAAREGLINPAKVQRVWIVTPDDRLCVLCQPMDGQQTGLGEPWQTEAGPVTTPNSIHVRCRCSEGLVFL
jgi:hypothetical protein